ncbi:MAG: ATP/GTP-binding protein [Dokdonella sp.]|uniref:GTP-binding protein n=1 Tax=Dokdonella sp. TaxID=2291710 RepID=UPI0025C461A4|nr:ATP/GTP-binding protein [Dokdonella sp.]MBZ0222915.1 ATP/GTP-binding protein [Dokdonella sp.]
MQTQDAAVAKLVLAGPMGAGKTTAIRSITDAAPVSTEMPLSEGASDDKDTTTVALDFGHAVLEDGTPLLVYGMPGQERFAFMRPILLEGAFGVVIILNAVDEDVSAQCEHWLREITAIDADLPVVIGITHTDRSASFSIEPVRAAIRNSGMPVPAFTFDARDKQQTFHLMRALLMDMQ